MRYELLYIIPTSFTDDEVGTIETKISGLLGKLGATIEATKRLGKLRLAYPVKRQRHGHYVMVHFTCEPTSVAKIEENLRITPEVLRHLILQADEAGADQKFELVQFNEVSIETREERARRREKKDTVVKEEELKAGVAAVEGEKEAPKEPVIAGAAITTEDLDKKIEAALNEDRKDV